MKTALITGLSGQDGSFMAEYLLGLGYRVYGLVRYEGSLKANLKRIADQVELIYGDMRDAISLELAVQKSNPEEIYNFAGQVFVPTSWHRPDVTFDTNVGGLARLLEAVERIKPTARVYQASSSEMFGNVGGVCDEESPFMPESPYAVSKLAAHHLCRTYRGKGLYVASGIAFNHESPRRGMEMVTRKITRHVSQWALGDKEKLRLGNLEAKRDWGFAGDYVKAMHAMLQQPEPRDFVIGTGNAHSVYEFLRTAISVAGLPERYCSEMVETDPQLIRPNDVRCLIANASQARQVLNWKPQVSFPQLVAMMYQSDLEMAQRVPSSQVASRG